MEGTERGERWYHRLGRGAPLAVILAAAFFVAYRILFILELIAIALLIAVLLRAVVDGLGRLGIGPRISAGIMVLALVAIAAAFWFFLVPRVTQEVQQLITSRPSGILNQAQDKANDRSGIFGFAPGALPLGFVPDVSSLIEQLRTYLSQTLYNQLPTLAREIFTIVLNVIATLFLALFLAIRPGAKVQGIMRLAPPDKREGFEDFLGDLNRRLRGWLVGAGVAMLFVGVSAALGLWIMGLPLAITFGIIAGLLNVVPFLGSILGALFPALLALIIDPVSVIWVLVLFLVINQIEGNVIQPLVMGSTAQVPPVLVLVSFLLLGGFLGPAGLLLAVPAMIVVLTILDWNVPDVSAGKDDSREQSASRDGWVPRLASRLKGGSG